MPPPPLPLRRSLTDLLAAAVLLAAVCGALYAVAYFLVSGHWPAW